VTNISLLLNYEIGNVDASKAIKSVCIVIN